MNPDPETTTAPKTTVFFRDDDVGDLTPGLRRFAALMLDHGFPVNYQAVPAHLTPAAADHLAEARSRQPGLVSVNQHGYRHEQMLRGVKRYSEFDGGRPYEDQHDAIARGRDRLHELLGAHFTPTVFTPPCHKFDANTLRALRDLGFEVLSVSSYPMLRARLYYALGRSLRRTRFLGSHVSYHGGRTAAFGLIELSCAIDVDEDVDSKGRRIVKSAADLVAELDRARARSRVVGIMFHHAGYDDPARVRTLSSFLDHIRSDPSIACATIEDIAASQK